MRCACHGQDRWSLPRLARQFSFNSPYTDRSYSANHRIAFTVLCSRNSTEQQKATRKHWIVYNLELLVVRIHFSFLLSHHRHHRRRCRSLRRSRHNTIPIVAAHTTVVRNRLSQCSACIRRNCSISKQLVEILVLNSTEPISLSSEEILSRSQTPFYKYE